MATTKVARSLTRSSTLAPAAMPATPVGVDSESRIRAADPIAVGLPEAPSIQLTDTNSCVQQTTTRRFKVRVDTRDFTVELNDQQALELAEELREAVGGPEADAVPTAPDRIVSDSHALIGAIRKDLAELWWYADQTLAGKSGCSPAVARVEIADLVCRLGLDLNHLDDEFAELMEVAQ